MGRNKKSGRGGRKRDDSFRSQPVDKDAMNNEHMAAYYRAQNIILDEEWDDFMEHLRQPLPTTFRVAGSRQIAHSLNGSIKEIYVPLLTDIVFEGEAIPPPAQIPWYPDGLGWQFNVSKKVLRKSPEFKKFHSFLVFETEVGNISRQEAVSMLPPLFLGVEPHHKVYISLPFSNTFETFAKVLDMCAAPGSKTAQLLEALHAHDTATASSFPSGLLIANDSDHKRTHLLIHQSARLPSPAFMVTNLDASNYPSIKIPSEKSSTKRRSGGSAQENLLFDRILCDVPCSGDGTIRKNVGIWKRWQPMDGNGLHALQLRILQRAMRMLNEDGRIVYSTCSMNPVENEAVVAAALVSNADFELVDMSTEFTALIRRSGITSWRPAGDRAINTFATYEEYVASVGRANVKLQSTHWPPSTVHDLNLHHCLRIYPHLQDTGGFFVAVLRRKSKSSHPTVVKAEQLDQKRSPDEALDHPNSKKQKIVSEGQAVYPPSNKNGSASTEEPGIMDGEQGDMQDNIPSVLPVGESATDNPYSEASKAPTTAVTKMKKGGDDASGFRENPYTFLAPDDPTICACIERLNLTDAFPSANVLVRNPEGEAVRSLYLTNDIVKHIVKYNDYVRIRLMTCGTKVFAKQEAGKGSEAQFRILGEALPVVLPYLKQETIMTGDIPSLKLLLETYYPLCISFEEPFRSTIESELQGGHIIKIPAGTWRSSTLNHDLVLPLWKSNVSVTLMIDKRAKSALSLRLFGEDITTAGRQSDKTAVPNTRELGGLSDGLKEDHATLDEVAEA